MTTYGTDSAVNYPTPVNGHTMARQTQISVECGEMSVKSELLLKQLADLEERLSLVLSPADKPLRSGSDQVRGNGPLAPHADFLRSRNLLLDVATDQLSSILSRLEI